MLTRKLGEPVTLGSPGWTIRSGLLYVSADDGLEHAWDPAGALAHQWLLDPARVAASVRGKRVDTALVTDTERVVDARWGMDDAIGAPTPARENDEHSMTFVWRNTTSDSILLPWR